MIDIILSSIDKNQPKEVQIHQLREQLQNIILKIMSDKKIFVNIAFLGGTALRICHNLQRYSEDLDFSLINKDNYNFIEIIKTIKSELVNNGFNIDIKYKQGVVDNVYIRFLNVLQKAGLSDIGSQKLAIKIEIDTNPPKGYELNRIIINNIAMYPIVLFDLPSLFAGKLHAILYRKFIKGRDRYDLIWYITNNIKPNLKLLQNAEIQSGVGDITKNQSQLIQKLQHKTQKITTKQLLDDVGIFLLHKNEKELLIIENIQQLISTIKINK